MRLLSLLLWWLAWLAFAAAGLIIITNILLSQENAQRELNNILARFFPGLSVDYNDVRVTFSLYGLHLQATALEITRDNTTLIRAPRADFWLRENTLQLALRTPDIYINPDAAVTTTGDNRRTLIISADHARLSFADFPVTLHQAEFALRRSGEQWHFYLNEDADDRQIKLQGVADSSLHGVVYAELSGLPPPAEAPVEWKRMNATLWVKNSAATGAVYHAIAELADVAGGGGRAERLSVRAVGAYHAGSDNIVTLAATGENITAAFSPVTAGLDMFGNLRWRGDAWHFHTARARLSGDEVTVTASAALAGAGSRLTAFAASGAAGAIKITAVHRYLPPGEVRDWFADSLRGGEISGAVFNLRPAADFAPENMTVRLTATVQDGVLKIDDDWPLLTAPTAVVAFNHDSIEINGNARLGELTANAVTARLPRLFDKRATLYLEIPFTPAAFNDYWATAGQIPPIRAALADAGQTFTVMSGRAEMFLTVSAPLAQPEEARFHAELDTRYLQAQTPEFPPLINAGGRAVINHDGVKGRIIGKLADPRLDAPPLTVDFTDTTQTISGGANVSLLMTSPEIPAFPAAGDIQFRIERSATLTVFTAPLQGVIIDLPAPLGKAANTFASISIRLAGGKTKVFFHNDALTLRLSDTPRGGDLAINAASRPPTGDGLNIHGAADNVNLDLWLAIAGDGGDDGAPAAGGIQLTVTDAMFMGLDHATLMIATPPPETDRVVRLQSPLLDGWLTVRTNAVSGHFSHLSLPGEFSDSGGGDFDIRQFTVSLTAATLRIDDLYLGAMELAGAPDGENWNLSRLNVSHQQTTLFLGGTFEQEHTYLTIILAAPDLPQLLDILGIEETIGEGRLSLAGSIAWPGSPTEFDAFSMRGLLRLQAEDVRYLDISFQSGVVNFLAIFSPQSLFSLGFTEIGKEGIIFDRVEGEIVIADGNASLRPVYLQSNDVVMDINGETNFIYRQHNLHGRVRPGQKLLKAGHSVGIGAGLLAVSPVSFIAGTLLGKVFERPISEIGAYNYTITGSWEKPVYIEVGIDPKSARP